MANILTVVLVYCFAMINHREKQGEEGHLTHLWLIVMVLLLMLYGLYTWGIYPFGLNLEVPTPEFLFAIQLAMLAGFVTSYPANWWLVKVGAQDRMGACRDECT